MTIQQAFVSEAFHTDDTIRHVYADLIGRAVRKARSMGGVFAEPGQWSMQGPLEDDDECYHVRLQFSLAVPDTTPTPCHWLCEGQAACTGNENPEDLCAYRARESNVVRGTE